MICRRGLLTGAAATLWPSSALGNEPYEVLDLDAGTWSVASRFTLLVPKHAPGPFPLLVAFHGLGETVDAKLGAWAWIDAYGLGSCYRRLLAPPVTPIEARGTFWTDQRLGDVNASLVAEPFRGVAVCCPYTPDVFKANQREKLLDAYAAWVVGEMLPRARKEAPVFRDARHTGIDGVSLGGYVSIEVFLRQARHFGAWGSVQGALGSYRALDYADKLAVAVDRFGPKRLHVETSQSDTYREDNDTLSQRLRDLGVPHDYLAPPGAHTQPFLRDSGTLEMLLWHDRALR